MSAFAEIYTAEKSAPAGWFALPWDSDQFGFPAARLEPGVNAHRLPHVLAECRRAGVRHLTARPDAGDLATIRALEAHGFQLLDVLQTFALKLESDSWPESAICMRPFRAADRDQVVKIARGAFTYDRFHSDDALPPGVADQVHETWIDNCCRGEMADVVWIAADADVVLGFITCKLDPERRIGTIGLVATKIIARRRGVGRSLLAQALRWFHQKGASGVHVGTQLANVPAAGLYQSFGFRPVSVSLTFRRLL
jgi:dTDP-4-amino-4,6-dideoxy-D-galactose acyltransferase